MGIPALVGLLLAAGVFAALGLPALGRLGQQRQRVGELHSKRDTLTLLEAQLKQSDQAVAEVVQQQALLVDLVAGRGKIQTFLAQLSRLSAASGVTINLYEPVATGSSSASTPAGTKNQQSGDGRSAAAGKDPLQALGYAKSSVLLQAQGPYQGVLQFLRRMEQLELLVQPSDLALTAVEVSAGDEDQPVMGGPPPTRLKLRLTFFDSDQEPGVDAASDSKAAESLD